MHRRRRRIEEAARVRSVEPTEIDAAGVRTTRGKVQQVGIVWQDLREQMADLARLQLGERRWITAGGGDAEHGTDLSRREDDPVAAPRAAARIWCIRQRLRRSPLDVDPL